MKVLTVPVQAQRDENAVQMMSAWIAERGMHCALNVGHFSAHGHDEPEAWGVLLADAVRHISQAIEMQTGRDRVRIEAEITKSLLLELGDPSSPASGDFVPGHS